VTAVIFRGHTSSVPLTYEAPPECATAAQFAEEVQARAPVGSAPARDETFDVAITHESTWRGRLAIGGATREVHGATCDEVTRALALAIATALEPPEPPEPPPPPPSEPLAAPVAAEVAPRARASSDLAFGGSMGATGGLAPSLAPEVALFGERAWSARAVRLGAALGLGPSIAAAEGHAFLRRAIVRAEGCPLALDSGAMRTSLCAALEAGPVFASGVDVTQAESHTRLWLAGGALGRVRWVFAPPFFAEIEARMTIPLLRDRYFSRPDTTIYETPAWVGAGAGAIGVRFP
jgi:hypothetical protein